ncbi:caspase family protein [Algirhabdus cladophorae]|uniref:caspase family protein n=1 Tax=Algirhabdus cladophorae TaxID=3377108 RepID=UPI003B848506
MSAIKLAFATLFAIVLSVTALVASVEKKTALIIGNGAYVHAMPLANPVNDARAMEAKLQALGFETYVGVDLDKFSMEMLLRDFSRAARKSDVNIFFYAGHGMSVDGINYLVPTDAAFADETSLDFEAVPVDFITRQMSLSDAVNLVFLDACRDNPLSQTLSRSLGATRSAAVSNGLAEMKVANTGKGMAIAFATSPGEVALDGDGFNSPFTTALLRHIDAENTDIAEIFTRVTGEVYDATEAQQRPWLNVSLTGPVMLNPVEAVAPQTTTAAVATVPTAPAAGGARLEEQKLLFDLARETGDIEDYRTYLQLFPQGVFARNAKRMVDQLSASATPAAVTGQRVASAAAGSRSAAINETSSLALPISATLRSLPANQTTEAPLGLNRTLKGNIQARLNATGNNVGGVDGQWGPKTRRGISAWQLSQGLPASGFLNVSQYELLVSQTEGRFTPYTYTAPKKRVATAPRKSSSGTRKSTASRNSNSNDALGAAILGAAIGAILSK